MRGLNYYEYRESQVIAQRDYSFYALIAAAMRQADNENTALLSGAFPQVHTDLKARYNAPGGRLPNEPAPDYEENE